MVGGGWCCCCCCCRCRLVCEATQDRVPVAGQNAKERVVFGSINKVRAASLDSYRHEGRRHYLSPESRRGTETVNTLGGTSYSEHSISSAVQSAQCSEGREVVSTLHG